MTHRFHFFFYGHCIAFFQANSRQAVDTPDHISSFSVYKVFGLTVTSEVILSVSNFQAYSVSRFFLTL